MFRALFGPVRRVHHRCRATVTALEIVGRDEELAVVASFLADTDSLPRVLVIEGEAGIGKTTVWRHVVEEGSAAGYRVLTARPGRSEAQLAFAGLSDLFEGSLDDVLPALPPPQARALRIALLLDDPGPRPADPRSVAAAVLGSLRHLTPRESLLVAIDDVQWLDASSAGALEFALRRLADEAVAVCMALRASEPSALSVTGVDEQRVKLRPLTLGALHRILVSRLGLALPRPALRRVTEVSGGNPFFALEIARAVEEQRLEPSGPHDPLPVPAGLTELLGGRLAALPSQTREALLVAALAAEPTVPIVSAVLDSDGWQRLRPAEERDVIAFHGEQVRFSHPLLAAAVEAEADLEQRRRAHARLATVVKDPTSRARHLALASSTPNESIAAVVADAAAHAAARGATAEAAQLADHAHRLTPADEPEAALIRLVDAARKHAATGEAQRAEALLRQELTTLPPGPRRTRVLSELADVEPSMERSVTLLRRALEEASGDDEVLSDVHLQLAAKLRITEDVWRAEAHAREALAIADRLGDVPTLVRALASVSLLRFNSGHGVSDAVLQRLLRLERRGGSLEVTRSPRFDVAEQLVWVGRHDEARPLLEGLRDELRSREDIEESAALWYLAFVELMAGRWTLAAEYSERGELLEEQAGFDVSPPMLWCRASVSGHRGEADAALRYGTLTVDAAERTGARAFAANGHGALGFLALSQDDVREARDQLRAWQEIWATTGYLEPGMWLYGPDVVESSVAVGELDAALAALELFEGRALALDRAHVLAQAARGRALIAAADGDLSEASAQIERALAEHARVRIPFHEARTYLALGSIERRRRRRRAARDALERALAEFEQLGARLWADRAREELARVGGRAPSRGELTPTERKVAELVAEGLATKDVASRLFVSPRTVDGHLAHIYAKLGVRSRTDLAHRLAETPTKDSQPGSSAVKPM
jgi:DNA-binding CsgD family transcriptional regulator/tetratricopeptide (TPR) repeat protein